MSMLYIVYFVVAFVVIIGIGTAGILLIRKGRRAIRTASPEAREAELGPAQGTAPEESRSEPRKSS